MERSSVEIPKLEADKVIFAYGEKEIDAVKSDEELIHLIQQANDGVISHKNARWIIPYTTYDFQFTEYILEENNGKSMEMGATLLDSEESYYFKKISRLVKEEYHQDTKDILVFRRNIRHPFLSPIVAKKFEDGSVKIGLLYPIHYDKVKKDKGWYSLEEIHQMIRAYQEDDEGGTFKGGEQKQVHIGILAIPVGVLVGIATLLSWKKIIK